MSMKRSPLADKAARLLLREVLSRPFVDGLLPGRDNRSGHRNLGRLQRVLLKGKPSGLTLGGFLKNGAFKVLAQPGLGRSSKAVGLFEEIVYTLDLQMPGVIKRIATLDPKAAEVLALARSKRSRKVKKKR